MESFPLLSISGLPSAALMSPRAASLPEIPKTEFPPEAPSLVQAPSPPHGSGALRHGVVLSPDCVLGDPQDSGVRPRRSCTIYRPWFSPYSYFVCVDKESFPGAQGLTELPQDRDRGDGCLPGGPADSAGSSSSSPDHACLREAARKPRPGADSADHITSQDLLSACRWLPAQQSGFKCVACCRMYPTLGALRSHVSSGFREGFSCRVFYRKLKALRAQPADRLSSSSSSSGGGQTHK